MKWPKKKLAEVASFQLGKMLDEKKNKGVMLPYLANVNVRWGQFDIESLREMRFEDHELERYGLKYGDIVMCEGGEPGRCAIWKDERPSIFYQKALHRIRPNLELLNAFLYYQFLFFGKTGVFEPLFTGATIKHMPREQLAKVEVSIPPLPTQQKIASILSAYDDLIENNLKRIKLLEEAAQNLYREWFVRFRFPGWEQVKMVDGLPEGWERKSLSEICNLTMGQSPSSEFYNETGEGLPFHQGVTNYGDRFVYHKTFCTNGTRIAEEGDILCSVRAPVGRLNITLDKIIIGRGLSAIRNKDNYQLFQFYQLKNHFVQENMIGGGTIFASVTKKELESQVFVYPINELLEQFERICKPIEHQIKNLYLQCQLLKEARDMLLPRLMNGALEV